ncbi:DNA methyltransferase [Treponema phagedenis]|uniref:DNA methyltransferase n=2 Tax=Treponema phagedenis TaxID=162 RepID=UPI0001F63B61|nr:DNA methyltransferase [Treponema phagedenis]EFW38615.1 DNA (cytosine-5-)-methyltransferase [Treponema phagedenis F0421]NVP24294.1 site-specific DNA-methyltransferase [Treponema phagedenis]QEJ94266.1 site-specific DNA-methyltransferase [Treponema phagedenis]QEK00224.1 site-specific DNA-methyltransferase [Treponema phagedenis]QEK07718.1 site-specific DNA-methyltransferase [Treponema phagedenis]
MNTTEYVTIDNTRLCNCKQNFLSCIAAKDWMKNQIGVWEFMYEPRDIRDKKIHPAVFPIAMAKRVIEQFTHRGELVLDPFVGSGTTLLAAQDLNRNAIGFDLKQEYVDLSNSRIAAPPAECRCKQIAICDDARNIANRIAPCTVKLAFTSPPYANILNRKRKNKSRRGDLRQNEQFGKVEQYSQDPNDLGTLEADDFEKAIAAIFAQMKPVFQEKAHVLINITDAWIDGKRVPLHINIINAMRDAGYEFRNTIIWDRRNLVNNIGIFGWPSSYITMGTTFEYILDFILPSSPKKSQKKE